VNVISRVGLLKASKKHDDARPSLEAWFKVARRATWRGLHEVRREFPSADQIGDVLVFNIKGNTYRLVTRVAYSRQRIWIKAFLTHAEYDRKEWMKWL
jgi:mRNA interferase HigB